MTFAVIRHRHAAHGHLRLTAVVLACALVLGACEIPFINEDESPAVTADQPAQAQQDNESDERDDSEPLIQIPDEAFQSDSTDIGEEPASPVRVVEGGLSEPRTLNPILIDDPLSDELSRLVFSGLTRLDPETGEPVPDLSASWDVDADGTTWTFRIREGLTWHDGQSFTAQDVEFTFDLMMDHRARSPRYSRIVERVSVVEALDARTVAFRLIAPYAPFPATIATFGIIPQHLLSNVLPDELVADPFGTSTAVGTGPFQLTHWSRGELIIFESYRGHHDGPPGFDIYEYQIATDAETLLLGLQTGAIDWARIDAHLASEVDAIDGVETVAIPSYEMVSVVLQLDSGKATVFDDATVRRALLHALDREEMVDRIWDGRAEVAHSIIPPSSWAASEAETRYEYSPGHAEDLLSEAGWVPEETWTRQREGVALEFRLLANGDNPVRRELAEWIASQWRDIGVDVTVDFDTWGAVRERITGSRDFEALLLGYRWEVDPDQHAMWSSDSIPDAFNLGSYRNREVDQLLDDALLTNDQEQRAEHYREMQEIVLNDLPVLPLAFPDQVIAVGPRLQSEEQTAILLRSRANVAGWHPKGEDAGDG